jgi:hypothetical protein
MSASAQPGCCAASGAITPWISAISSEPCSTGLMWKVGSLTLASWVVLWQSPYQKDAHLSLFRHPCIFNKKIAIAPTPSRSARLLPGSLTFRRNPLSNMRSSLHLLEPYVPVGLTRPAQPSRRMWDFGMLRAGLEVYWSRFSRFRRGSLQLPAGRAPPKPERTAMRTNRQSECKGSGRGENRRERQARRECPSP